LAIPWLAKNVPAILECWQLGTTTGTALADIVFGDVNPSGKLPVTFPRSVGQVPIYYNHKNTGRPPSEEKWTSKYIDLPVEPLFPFGHGLSYTKFEYTNLRLSESKIGVADSIVVTVDVKNVGQRSGDEVVQLYIQDEVATVTRPVKELRGFQRVTLASGSAKTVSFILRPADLSFYNLQMQKVVEPGWFKVFVGTSSADVTEARFEVTADQ
jgi:beta-glucosidase